jgi:signal transduction histidine kinase
VRELLVNVAKHAGVNQASMACESEKDWIRIRVVDKGRGFDLLPSRSRKVEHGGFGLTIVRARLGHLGGNLHIDSHIGMGTRATIVLPYR